jgi:5'-3' exonuclease
LVRELLGLTKFQLILLAALVGCDNMRGIHGIGIRTGLGIVKKILSTDMKLVRIFVKWSVKPSFRSAVDLALDDLVKFQSGMLYDSLSANPNTYSSVPPPCLKD